MGSFHENLEDPGADRNVGNKDYAHKVSARN